MIKKTTAMMNGYRAAIVCGVLVSYKYIYFHPLIRKESIWELKGKASD